MPLEGGHAAGPTEYRTGIVSSSAHASMAAADHDRVEAALVESTGPAM